MNNLQFIATYIFENPDNARYNEIIRNLMLWKGHPAWAIANIGGWYSRYFTMFPSNGTSYQPTLWVKTDPTNRNSGFKLTPKGMTYVIKGA